MVHLDGYGVDIGGLSGDAGHRGLFKIGWVDGPKIYPEGYHYALYSFGWHISTDEEKEGKRPPISSEYERPWFYGFEGKLTEKEQKIRDQMDQKISEINQISDAVKRFDQLRNERDLPNSMAQTEDLEVVHKRNTQAMKEQFQKLMNLDRKALLLHLNLICLASEDEGQVLTAGEILYRISTMEYKEVHQTLLRSRPKYLEAYEGVRERFMNGKIEEW